MVLQLRFKLKLMQALPRPSACEPGTSVCRLVLGLRKQRKTKGEALGASTLAGAGASGSMTNGNAASQPGPDDALRQKLAAAQQGHVFEHWEGLAHDERRQLLADLQARPCSGKPSGAGRSPASACLVTSLQRPAPCLRTL